MIILPSTTDKLQVITSAAGTVDVVVSYGEVSQATPPVVQPFGRQLSSISSATTTDILAAPSSSITRTPEEITIRNSHASVSNTITVRYNANGTTYEIYKATLAPGELVEYVRGLGWFLVASSMPTVRNQSTSDQVFTAGTEAYLTGSAIAIPPNRPITVGTRFHWRLGASKTAAGTAAWAFNVRFGTLGTTSDTARLTFTHGQVGTAATDTAVWEIRVIVRGPISSSCVVAGMMEFQHRNDVTGFSILRVDGLTVVSSAFDITTSGMIVGLSYAPGASSVPTFNIVSAECENI